MGLAKKASANILAQARLIDAGYGVRYDSARDQYEVDTDSKPMKFTRKVNRGGKRSPHYTHVIERAYVMSRLLWREIIRQGSRGEKERQQKLARTFYQSSHTDRGKG